MWALNSSELWKNGLGPANITLWRLAYGKSLTMETTILQRTTIERKVINTFFLGRPGGVQNQENAPIGISIFWEVHDLLPWPKNWLVHERLAA